MASEQMRKKWGTIFMGEREATVEQLDAMQEPMRREQRKQEQEADYMERVRARAADRARQILGEAYAERLKVLEEAKAETAAQRRETAKQCAALRAEAESLRAEAAEELARAQAEREAAVRVREAAHGEGFQTGMDQAGQELREFRAELGQSLGALLRAVAAQRAALVQTWREELAELTREAVAAGTGFVLSAAHADILRTLTLQAVSLLENRATISVRVNPADEAAVSDMFAAARERAPELAQWIVNGDESVEPGGLVAESGSGSVDCRREHFREMVDNILRHLALPEREGEAAADAAVDELVDRETGRMAALAPEPEPAEATPTPDTAPDTGPDTGAATGPEDAPEPAAQPAVGPDTGPDTGPDMGPDTDLPPAMDDDFPDLSALPPDDIDAAPTHAEATPEPADTTGRAAMVDDTVADAAAAGAAAPAPADAPVDGDAPHAAAPEPHVADSGAVDASGITDDALAWLPPLGEPGGDAGAGVSDAPHVPAGEAEAAPPREAATATDNPSIAELEEELFPLSDGVPEADSAALQAGAQIPPEGAGQSASAGDAGASAPPHDVPPHEAAPGDDVLAHGGFLPGS